MKPYPSLEVWFVTGSQHLYGPETLQQVAADAQAVALALDASDSIPVRVVCKPVLTTPEAIHLLCQEANSAPNCIGLVTWMHTFSPAKMWIAGLKVLHKPFVDLHTQFGSDIPWSTIDMDFMNLNQTAHGGREFGYITARMRLPRKIVVGHWQDPEVLADLGIWVRAAAAWHDAQGARIARFGDNMRDVAVTEGDKVEAQLRLGYGVYGYGVGDLAHCVGEVSDAEVERLLQEYAGAYILADDLRPGGAHRAALAEAARIELGMRTFLTAGRFKAFTTTFEDLHGLVQLPGLAVQRLMADGYGFGAEGDWKTAALMRVMKIIGGEGGGGTSFMEDYTYDLTPGRELVLGAHMLEVCPSIAAGRARIEVHPLGIGDREPPARLVFEGHPGPAVLASLIDMGGRMRLIVQDIQAVEPVYKMPNLPVARIMWKPMPDLMTGAEAWITAGGAHHTVLSFDVSAEQLRDWARIQGIEFVHIDADTRPERLERELFLSDLAWKLN